MRSGFETTFTEEISEPCPEGIGVTIYDFVAYMPSHTYIFMPCNEIVGGNVALRNRMYYSNREPVKRIADSEHTQVVVLIGARCDKCLSVRSSPSCQSLYCNPASFR